MCCQSRQWWAAISAWTCWGRCPGSRPGSWTRRWTRLPGRRCDLLLALGEALGPAGEPQRAYENVAEEAFVLADGVGDSGRAARAAELAVESAWRYAGSRGTVGPLYHRWVERLAACAAQGT